MTNLSKDLPDTATVSLTVAQLKAYVESILEDVIASMEIKARVPHGFDPDVVVKFEHPFSGYKIHAVDRSLLSLLTQAAEHGLDGGKTWKLEQVMKTYIQAFPDEAFRFKENNNRDTGARNYVSLNNPIWDNESLKNLFLR